MKIRSLLQKVYFLDLLKWKRSLSNQIIRSVNDKNLIKFQDPNNTEESSQYNTIPIFKKALLNGNNNSIKDSFGQYTYSELFINSNRLSRQISNICGGSGANSTVAFLSDNNVLTVLMLWASWMSGQVVIPLLSNEMPPFHLNLCFIKRNNVKLLLSPDKFAELGRKLAFDNNIPLLIIRHKFLKFRKNSSDSDMVNQNKIFDGILLNSFYGKSGAYLFYEYSSGGHIRPITILRTHKDLNKFVNMAVKTWHLSENDRILNITPFQFFKNEFVYNVLFTLSAGSHITILEHFDGKSAWSLILGLSLPNKERYNVLMAEPKVYEELVQEYKTIFAKDAEMIAYIKNYCLNNYRLMIISCGHLDPRVFSAWMEITGHTLLENSFLKIVNNADDNNTFHPSHKRSTTRIRVVDGDQTILLETDERCVKRFQSTESSVVVGRLMISEYETQDFQYTGEIVLYNKGVFKVIGQHCFNMR